MELQNDEIKDLGSWYGTPGLMWLLQGGLHIIHQLRGPMITLTYHVMTPMTVDGGTGHCEG